MLNPQLTHSVNLALGFYEEETESKEGMAATFFNMKASTASSNKLIDTMTTEFVDILAKKDLIPDEASEYLEECHTDLPKMSDINYDSDLMNGLMDFGENMGEYYKDLVSSIIQAPNMAQEMCPLTGAGVKMCASELALVVAFMKTIINQKTQEIKNMKFGVLDIIVSLIGTPILFAFNEFMKVLSLITGTVTSHIDMVRGLSIQAPPVPVDFGSNPPPASTPPIPLEEYANIVENNMVELTSKFEAKRLELIRLINSTSLSTRALFNLVNLSMYLQSVASFLQSLSKVSNTEELADLVCDSSVSEYGGFMNEFSSDMGFDKDKEYPPPPEDIKQDIEQHKFNIYENMG